MKRTRSLIYLALCFALPATLFGQDDFRFKQDSSFQIESEIRTGGHGYLGYRSFFIVLFAGDTIIDDHPYQIIKNKPFCHYNFDTNRMDYRSSMYRIGGYIRRDAERVYYKFTGSLPEWVSEDAEFAENGDLLIFDFGVEEGDTVNWKNDFQVVEKVDSLTLENGEIRKRIIFHRLNGWEYYSDIWIEGVGSSRGLLGGVRPSSPWPEGPHINLSCDYGAMYALQYDFWASESNHNPDLLFDCLEDIFPKEEVDVDSPHQDFTIFPNPLLANHLTLVAPYPTKDVSSVSIFNIKGELVRRVPIDNQSQADFRLRLPIDLIEGVYLVSVELHSGQILSAKLLRL